MFSRNDGSRKYGQDQKRVKRFLRVKDVNFYNFSKDFHVNETAFELPLEGPVGRKTSLRENERR